MFKFNPNHLPHDPRNAFITIVKKYKVDKYAIKHMVGHTIKDATEQVYTTRDNSWPQSEFRKIK